MHIISKLNDFILNVHSAQFGFHAHSIQFTSIQLWRWFEQCPVGEERNYGANCRALTGKGIGSEWHWNYKAEVKHHKLTNTPNYHSLCTRKPFCKVTFDQKHLSPIGECSQKVDGSSNSSSSGNDQRNEAFTIKPDCHKSLWLPLIQVKHGSISIQTSKSCLTSLMLCHPPPQHTCNT